MSHIDWTKLNTKPLLSALQTTIWILCRGFLIRRFWVQVPGAHQISVYFRLTFSTYSLFLRIPRAISTSQRAGWLDSGLTSPSSDPFVNLA
jgi:hypothetical protein